MTNPPLDFESLLLEVDVKRMSRELLDLQQHIRAVLPDELVFDSSGAPNLRNRYGAIVAHAAYLRAILDTFGNESN